VAEMRGRMEAGVWNWCGNGKDGAVKNPFWNGEWDVRDTLPMVQLPAYIGRTEKWRLHEIAYDMQKLANNTGKVHAKRFYFPPRWRAPEWVTWEREGPEGQFWTMTVAPAEPPQHKTT
jgi:hypothetical protein